jgi:hypothetical protein
VYVCFSSEKSATQSSPEQSVPSLPSAATTQALLKTTPPSDAVLNVSEDVTASADLSISTAADINLQLPDIGTVAGPDVAFKAALWIRNILFLMRIRIFSFIQMRILLKVSILEFLKF